MVLFICAECGYGHKSTNVNWYVTETGRYVYYCYDHLNLVPTNIRHIPWCDQESGFDPSKFIVSRVDGISHATAGSGCGVGGSCKFCARQRGKLYLLQLQQHR